MKRILIISFSEIKDDPRVYRQLQLLCRYFDVTAAGFGTCPLSTVDWVSIPFPTRTRIDQLKNALLLATRQFERSYWNRQLHRDALSLLGGGKFDLVIANDIDAMPLALQIADDSPVLLDAHEYYPREYEDSLIWRMVVQPFRKYLCKHYLPQASAMMTVCKGLADEYQRVYGIESLVVINAPEYQDLEPTPVVNETIRMIHHGAAIPSRHLESMIEMMAFLDVRFELDFMLVPSDHHYMARLKKLAAGNRRIRFLEPVAMLDIARVTNVYDIGIFLLPPVNFNYANALPNKFFEFVQARLGVAVGPSPEMARMVEDYSLGVISKDFEPKTMAKTLNSLSAQDVTIFKQASHAAARELSFARSSELLLGEVRRLLG